jgi:hypothetical protein
MVVDEAILSNNGLNKSSRNFEIFSVGCFKPEIIGRRGVPNLWAFGK